MRGQGNGGAPKPAKQPYFCPTNQPARLILFSSLLFLWVALPIIWFVSLPLPRQWQNLWLLLTSIIVYAWGGVGYTGILLGSILFNYGIGRMLSPDKNGLGSADPRGASLQLSPGGSTFTTPSRRRSPQVNHSLSRSHRPERRWWLALGVVGNLATLAYFKYAMFTLGQTNSLLRWLGEAPLEIPRITLPLGISFFTFQAISYLVDVYRKTTPAQHNPIKLGLYISFFPQLIAGPIVRYHDLDQQLSGRTRSWEKTTEGLERFLIGLAKKVLIANTLASVVDEVFALNFATMDVLTAWAGVCLYSLQLYYDFSGYSDMAIGLALLFGFRIPENFNFPYASKSIREFWRRWHITLGAWFRDYLYIPLGGSHGTSGQTARNLLLVFLATGFWHGAAWAFVLWGLWHGLFIVLERQKWWPFRNVAYALLVVLLGWVLFKTESLDLSLQYYAAMFGLNGATVAFDWAFYWSGEQTIAAAVALAGCWPWWKGMARPTSTAPAPPAPRSPANVQNILAISKILGLLVLFFLATNALVNNNLNPFIYFRF